MRPKDLKFPFTWANRKPAFHEGVLIVPQHYEDHHLWKDETNLFSPEKSIHIEYCSGNGDWVLEKATSYPDQMWVAVEKQFERVRKIWSKMQNRKIKNLLIVCGEGLTFTSHYLPDQTIEEIFVNFPDPWPKVRHAKHRIVQKSFVEQIARVVKKGGRATFATDHELYSKQMIDSMNEHTSWRSKFPDPYYVQNWENYGGSWFENLWREKGRNFYYMNFEKL